MKWTVKGKKVKVVCSC